MYASVAVPRTRGGDPHCMCHQDDLLGMELGIGEDGVDCSFDGLFAHVRDR